MKKILLFITLISFSITQSQIVNIPDVNFKNKLLSTATINTNGDAEIQITEAESLTGTLHLTQLNISDLTGIEAFINITGLLCNSNQITNLDVSNSLNLTNLNCSYNQIENLNVNGLSNLSTLKCRINNLTSLDISDLSNLLYFDCDYNQLTTLSINENINLIEFSCSNNSIQSLNLNSLINIQDLRINNNELSTLEINGLSNLGFLDCSDNLLTSLNLNNLTSLNNLICESNLLNLTIFSNLPNLYNLSISNNQLNNLDISNLNNLEFLDCSYNLLENLDLSILSNIYQFNVNNNQLISLFIKNGVIEFENGGENSSFENNPNLEYICVDDLEFENTLDLVNQYNYSSVINTYCSFQPAFYNEINGNVKYDMNINGCDSSDLNISNMRINTNNTTESNTTFTFNNGNYKLYTNEGDFTTTIAINLPNYFTVNPSSQTNTFTGFNNTFTADFCIEPNQTVNDVNISIIPIIPARPGFNTTYQIVYKNVGTTQLNENVTLEFDDTKLSFLNASETVNAQTSSSLTFDYTNLNPFETRTIDLEFNVFTPPTVEIDDILNFTAIINPIAGDFTTDDNIFELNQTVVGSFDPNDITVLEGNQILLADADKYLHYVIRFQNTGTASAINVVVTNNLNANLDWSTLQLENISHNNRVAIKNGNEIEFIFENINLPDSTTDEPNSHGFIAYKIKPKTDIALGDIIPNKADIFFDFNAPIETNTATTTIVNTLAVNENILLDFSVYPTPTENILNIKSKTEIVKVEIYSKLGQKIKETTKNNIDISNLTQGLYFVKVKDANGNFGVKKIVKK